MSTCVILSTLALALILYFLIMNREITVSKEGFVEYIVYGPGPWYGWGPRRPWYHRRWHNPYLWPGRAAWFY